MVWFGRGAILPLGEDLECLETFLVVTAGEGALLKSSEQEARAQPNSLQCTQQPPQQRTVWPKMSTALKLRRYSLTIMMNSLVDLFQLICHSLRLFF